MREVRYHQGPVGPVYEIYDSGDKDLLRRVGRVSYEVRKFNKKDFEQKIICDEHGDDECSCKVEVEAFRKQDAVEALTILGALNLPKLRK